MNNEVLKIIESNFGRIITGNPENKFEELTISCNNRHLFELYPKDIKKGKWCPECNPMEYKLESFFKEYDIEYDKKVCYDYFTFDYQINLGDSNNIKNTNSPIIPKNSKIPEKPKDLKKNKNPSNNKTRKYLFIRPSEADKNKIFVAKKYGYNIIFYKEILDFHKDYIFDCLQQNDVDVIYLPTRSPQEFVVEKSTCDLITYIKGDKSIVKTCSNIPEDVYSIDISKESKKNNTARVIDNLRIAIAYCRVSTEMQAEKGMSLEEQETAILKKAEQEGKFLYKVYIDRGISGRERENRYAFEKMIEDIQENQTVYCRYVTRFARNWGDTATAVNEIKKKGAKIVFLDLNIDVSEPLGQAQLGFSAILAQLESDNKSYSSKEMVKYMKEKGIYSGGRPPIGKKINPDKSGNTPIYLDDEDEMKVINKIIKLRKANQDIGITRFTKILNQSTLKPLRRAKNWHHTAVARILDKY